MVVTNLQNKKLSSFLQRFIADYPDITFANSATTHWDPKNRRIHYNQTQPNVIWAILHEIGHMQLGHTAYSNDLELIVMEKDAWNYAKELSKTYNYPIDNGHIQDCLDSYRDWLHKRSTCPQCQQTGIQTSPTEYSCLNCRQRWSVTISRFCRSYRKKIKSSVDLKRTTDDF